jgi:hypothetical protein
MTFDFQIPIVISEVLQESGPQHSQEQIQRQPPPTPPTLTRFWIRTQIRTRTQTGKDSETESACGELCKISFNKPTIEILN